MRAWLIGGSALALILAGYGAGYGTREFIGMRRVEACAQGIAQGRVEQCSDSIERAFKALGQQAAAQAVEERDAVTPEIAITVREVRAAAEAQARDVAALNRVEKTNACAASPAFQLRRRQLQLDAEARANPDHTEADAPAG